MRTLHDETDEKIPVNLNDCVVPCVHLHDDSDIVCFSIKKVDRILLLTRIHGHCMTQTLFWYTSVIDDVRAFVSHTTNVEGILRKGHLFAAFIL